MNYNSTDFLTNIIGMPAVHKKAFLNVAAQEMCVIMVRATGPTCHGLLEEGYDTKGYRIHGKSCDWGPMAGFVMRDPRLNKYGLGKERFNREKHIEALYDDREVQGWLAATTPLKISQARLDWLVRVGRISVTRAKTSQALSYKDWMRDTNIGFLSVRSMSLKAVDKALERYEHSSNVSNFEDLKLAFAVYRQTLGANWDTDARNHRHALDQLYTLAVENSRANFMLNRLDGQATHASGLSFHYSLFREGDLYGVYFDNTRSERSWVQQEDILDKANFLHGTKYEPMLAMTNPVEHRLHRSEHYHNAITGDYDLFCIWPSAKKYNASVYGNDHRPLGTVRGSVGRVERENADRLERQFARQGLQGAQLARHAGSGGTFQGTKLGNITPRIYMVCQMVNSHVGRHVLWHSDEAARPFLDDVDLPVIAFKPDGNYIGIENIADFKDFIAICEVEGFHISLSNAWAQNPDRKFRKRLGADYAGYVPADGERIIVPEWYNR